MATDILARLNADPTPDADERNLMVLAALDGRAALDRYLDDGAAPTKPKAQATPDAPAREPLGAYLKSITVEGFRGVGPKKTLDLPPGPGLTLVVGRNGSGKSSFAEALELLLTGNTFRWRKPRPAIWREGWRNLHHKPTAIEAEFYVEGDKPTRVVPFAQAHGKKQCDPASLGWDPALKTYQPILSYNELGTMPHEGEDEGQE